jgi:hypothetical protein
VVARTLTTEVPNPTTNVLLSALTGSACNVCHTYKRIVKIVCWVHVYDNCTGYSIVSQLCARSGVTRNCIT